MAAPGAWTCTPRTPARPARPSSGSTPFPVWRDTPFFTPRERAALAWTGGVTELGREGVPDNVYEAARSHITEEELVRLTVAAVAINGWNRLNVAFRSEIGSYRPRQREASR
jgi:alkylhydroperoxidase family enzyme